MDSQIINWSPRLPNSNHN